MFIEELTKAVLEAGAQPPAVLSAMPHPGLTVPATLHASLMARLDRLGPAAREVAQAGAAIGREFGYGLLASVTDLPEPQLCEALNRLTGAALVFARGTPPEANYLFKHALVRDAAYGSLLRGRRQSLHRRIIATLEERFPEIVAAQPALLAQHCQESGLAEQAVAYWLKAAQQALACGAMAEVVTQARKGLEVLGTLSDSPWRREQEQELQTNLAFGFVATKDSSATETVETLARAQALAEQLGRSEHLVPLLFGRWSIHIKRAELMLALSLGKQIEDIGEVRNDVAAQAAGRLLQGIPRLYLGELVPARSLLEEHADQTPRSVNPPNAYFRAFRLASFGAALGLLGYVDQARSRMDEALSLARRVGNAFVLSRILIGASLLDHYIGSPFIHAEELLNRVHFGNRGYVGP